MFDNFMESEEDTIEETDSIFEVLSNIQVSEYMKKIIKDISVDSNNATNVRILLNQFEWNQQKVSDVLYSNIGTGENNILKQIKSSELVKVETSIDCSICFENHSDHMFGLNCGHVYCYSCWTFYISIKITDQDDSTITCPGSISCPTRINDESLFDFIDNQDIITKYQQLIIKSFIQLNPMLKWCPGPDCNYTIHQIQNNVDQAAIQVECICGYEFCFQCSQPFHDPAIVSCDLMEKWISNLPTSEDDSKTLAYFQKNIKNCPKCHIPIEKSHGCDYVKCKNVVCKTAFCYKCLTPLRGLDLCKCRKVSDILLGPFNPIINFLFSRSREESVNSPTASQPYLIMTKNKYLHHEMSLNLEKKILKNVNLKNYMEEEILKTLLKSRQTLINAYVFSNFYISPFFENEVSNLEIVTDKLSQLVQSDLKQNFTQIKIISEECKRLRNDLSVHIEIGHKNNWWIMKEQPKIEMKFDRIQSNLDLLVDVLLYVIFPTFLYLFVFIWYFYHEDDYIERLLEATCFWCITLVLGLGIFELIFRHI